MTLRSAFLQHLHRAADLRLLLLLLAVLGILVALDRPQMLRERSVFRYVLVFDITASMNVSDVALGDAPVTRLVLAKQAARYALSELPCGSEVGLAIFTERRALLLSTPVEVCRHYGNISAMLDQIDGRLAWRARSEIARGLNSSLQLTAALARPTRLVFLSDGHEAPPIHPDFGIPLDPSAREVSGLIVGVGGDEPVPIPRIDPGGEVVGFWSADDVQQVDSYSLGRKTSASEPLVGVDTSDLERRIARGTEHLSSLHERYLQRLAGEAGLDYYRLDSAKALAQQLVHPAHAERQAAVAELHWLASLPAALCVLGAVSGIRRRRHAGS